MGLHYCRLAITFPFVFGWLHFESLPDDLRIGIRPIIFGFPTFTFPIHSLFGFSTLSWPGLGLVFGDRWGDAGDAPPHARSRAAAVQMFSEDFMPLILLFAVSVTGLMLTASYTWLKGYAYDFIAILHAITVIGTFLWLPFGKFFHIFQRPAQIGVRFYKDVGHATKRPIVAVAARPFTSRMHVEDLIQTEQALGYRYEMKGTVRALSVDLPPLPSGDGAPWPRRNYGSRNAVASSWQVASTDRRHRSMSTRVCVKDRWAKKMPRNFHP